METEDDYKFLEIKDAISSINQKVNLIGVVLEFGIPRQTKGTGIFSFSSSYISFNLFVFNCRRIFYFVYIDNVNIKIF